MVFSLSCLSGTDPAVAIDTSEKATLLRGTNGEANQETIEQLPKGVEVPLHYNPPHQNKPVIYMSINGSEPLPFVLDTGSGMSTVLFSWAAEYTKVPMTKDTETIQPGNIAAKVTGKYEIRIPPAPGSDTIKINVIDSGVIPEPEMFRGYPGMRIAGIYGGDIFQQSTADFDFDRKIVTFIFDSHPRLRPKNSEAIILKLLPQFRDERPHIKVKTQEGIEALLGVDTGFNGYALIPSSLLPKVKTLGEDKGDGNDLGGSREITQAILPALFLGDHEVKGVPVDFGALTPALGMKLLSRYRVTLDTENKELILQPRKNQSDIPLPGLTGIYVKGEKAKEQSYWRVELIEANSPAEQAGILRGERLLELDGYKVTDCSDVIFANLLNGPAGSELTLLIENPKTKMQRTVKLTRTGIFPNLELPKKE